MDTYDEDEIKFFQSFEIEHNENSTLKRVFSLKIKTKELSEKWLELKNKCEHDEDKSFLKEWIYQYDSNLFKNLSFRQRNNYQFWGKGDNDIIIMYCEYVSDNVIDQINNCDNYMTKFVFKWNFEILKPIINDFVNYATKYTSDQNISGKIEFVHTGSKVNVCYL